MTDRELMQMALDAMELFESGTNGLYKGEFADERKALRDRLAQPEREWVGLTDLAYRLRKRAEIRMQIPDRKSVQEGKPDRIADLLEEAADALDKQWVGLTEEEMEDIWNERGWYVTLFQKVEAKLKEKNT